VIYLSIQLTNGSRDSSVSITHGYGLVDWGFTSQHGLRIFLFPTAVSTPILGTTQPPVQWVSRTLSVEVKRPGREADHSPPSSAEVNNAWSYTFTPPIRLHGLVFSEAQGQLHLYLYGSDIQSSLNFTSTTPIRLHAKVLSTRKALPFSF
jgi:hypothetical protein